MTMRMQKPHRINTCKLHAIRSVRGVCDSATGSTYALASLSSSIVMILSGSLSWEYGSLAIWHTTHTVVWLPSDSRYITRASLHAMQGRYPPLAFMFHICYSRMHWCLYMCMYMYSLTAYETSNLDLIEVRVGGWEVFRAYCAVVEISESEVR